MPCITGNDANEVKIAAQFGIEALLKAMKEHPTIAGMQEEACGALGNIVV